MALVPVASSLAVALASIAVHAAGTLAAVVTVRGLYNPDRTVEIVQEARDAIQYGTLSAYLASVDADGLARGLAWDWDQGLCEAILRTCDARVAKPILARMTARDRLVSNPDSAAAALHLFENAQRLPVLIGALKLGRRSNELAEAFKRGVGGTSIEGCIDTQGILSAALEGRGSFAISHFVERALAIEEGVDYMAAGAPGDPRYFMAADADYERLLQEAARPRPQAPPGVRV
jgi:hypothetical protein